MRKKDLSILRNLKREEAKVQESQPKEEVTVAQSDETVQFDVWWVDVNKLIKLPSYMKEIVWADFRGRGLNKSETKKAYEDAIRLFGYKI
jgi:hypothetical protein